MYGNAEFPVPGATRPAVRGTQRRLLTRRLSIDPWLVGIIALALPMMVPALVVLSSLIAPEVAIWRHLVSTVLGDYVVNSLLLMLGVGVGTAAIGVGAAWLVTMCHFPGYRVFEWLMLLPMAMPAYVLAYTYTGLLDFAGPVQTSLRDTFGLTAADYSLPEIRSLGGAIVMLTLVLYPYVYMLARAAFLEQSVCVLEAGRTLGRGPWFCFLRIALPLARPAIVGGLALALMETLNDFGTVQYFAVDTFTTGIYRAWFGMGEPHAAAQLGGVLTLFVLGIVLAERASRGRAAYHHTTNRYRTLPRISLSRRSALGAMVLCLLPPLLGFLLPGAVLTAWATETVLRGAFDSRAVTFAVNSLMLASLAALLAVGLALVMAYGRRHRPSMVLAGLVRLASLGYAIPGSVVAIGIMMTLATTDHAIGTVVGAVTGVSSGLLLSGTILAVVYAYLVRFLAVSFNTVEAGLAKVTPNLDGASRTLGLGRFATLRRVHAPLLRSSILTAGLLVFVDAMKELPATLILRPFNFDTLSISTYQLAKSELLREAAAPGLLIVLAGLLPVILLSRAIARGRPGRDTTRDSRAC